MNLKPNMILLGVFSGVLNIGIAMSVVTIFANLEHRSGPASSVANLGHFLLAYPSANYRRTAMRQELWQRHENQITYWRIVDSDSSKSDLHIEIARARRSFAEECAALQGDIMASYKRLHPIHAVESADGRLAKREAVYPDICVGGKGRALGALYAYRLNVKRPLQRATYPVAAFFATTGDLVDGPMVTAATATRSQNSSNFTSAKSKKRGAQ